LKGSLPSRENAMKYFINTQAWSEMANIDVFYFSSLMNRGKLVLRVTLVHIGVFGIRMKI
jgi:hypothetical protein